MGNSPKCLILRAFLPIFLCWKSVHIFGTKCGQIRPLWRMATPFCQRVRKNSKKRDFCNFQGFPQNPVENEYFVNKLNFFQNLYKGRDSFLSGAYFLHSFKKPIKSSICIGFYALFYTVFNIVFCDVEKLWIIREPFHSS